MFPDPLDQKTTSAKQSSDNLQPAHQLSSDVTTNSSSSSSDFQEQPRPAGSSLHGQAQLNRADYVPQSDQGVSSEFPRLDTAEIPQSKNSKIRNIGAEKSSPEIANLDTFPHSEAGRPNIFQNQGDSNRNVNSEPAFFDPRDTSESSDGKAYAADSELSDENKSVIDSEVIFQRSSSIKLVSIGRGSSGSPDQSSSIPSSSLANQPSNLISNQPIKSNPVIEQPNLSRHTNQVGQSSTNTSLQSSSSNDSKPNISNQNQSNLINPNLPPPSQAIQILETPFNYQLLRSRGREVNQAITSFYIAISLN